MREAEFDEIIVEVMVDGGCVPVLPTAFPMWLALDGGAGWPRAISKLRESLHSPAFCDSEEGQSLARSLFSLGFLKPSRSMACGGDRLFPKACLKSALPFAAAFGLHRNAHPTIKMAKQRENHRSRIMVERVSTLSYITSPLMSSYMRSGC
jgi:hypothetical protein